MALCTVSGTILDLSEEPVVGVVIKANLTSPIFIETSQIIPEEISTTTDEDGNWELDLVQTASVCIAIEYPPNPLNTKIRVTYAILIPDEATADFSELITEL